MSAPDEENFRDWLFDLVQRETGMTREEVTKKWAEERREEQRRRRVARRRPGATAPAAVKHWAETDDEE